MLYVCLYLYFCVKGVTCSLNKFHLLREALKDVINTLFITSCLLKKKIFLIKANNE